MSGYTQTRYLLSAHDLTHAPPDRGAEVAFAGRSNAGKSSALNALTGLRALARTSKTPGRTQAINFFEVKEGCRLVDLPGYGYARVPEAVKRQWQHVLEKYFQRRRSLRGLILVMDIRHPLTDFDLQMLDWCQAAGMPYHALLTKADKLSRGAAATALLEVRRKLEQRYGAAQAQVFSALKHIGLAEARDVLDAWLGLRDVHKNN